MDVLLLIGRILLSLIFIMSGINHLTKAGDMAQYAGSKNVPAPKAAVIVSGLLMLLGGLSVAFGYMVETGAVLLLIALIPITIMMHDFWKVEDPQTKMVEMTMFMKNVALIGAALILLYHGAGPLGLD